MNTFKDHILLLLCVSISLIVRAQVGNEGTFTVAEGTQVSIESSFSNASTGVISNDGQLLLSDQLINNGSFTYSLSNGLEGRLTLNGTNQQSISGSGMIEVLRLNLENPAGFANTATLSVANQMTLTQGVFDNLNFGGSLWLDGNVAVNGASDTSFVLGDVFLTNETEAILPTGDAGAYQGMALQVAATGLNTFSARFDATNSNDLHLHSQKEETIDEILTNGFWEVQPLSATSGVLVSLSYNDLIPASWLSQIDQIRVVNYDETEGIWKDKGGVVDADTGTISSTTASLGYGIFTLALGIDFSSCTLNCDFDNDGACDLNCDTDGDGECDINCDSNGDGICNLNCDTDGDGACDLNCDTDGDGECDLNCDSNGDGTCNLNCDTDGDGVCDLNCDTDGDGECDLNCDANGDGTCNLNCDTDGDGVCDLNCDTDGDGQCDENCVLSEGVCFANCDLQILHDVVSKSNVNQFFRIENISSFPDNTFRVFDRYGVEVFEISGYDNESNVFKGFSNKGALLTVGSPLNNGVYFYVIDYVKEGQELKQIGYLYIRP